MDLQALEEIRRLKYRYFRTLDLKLWDEYADTFTEDAVGMFGTKVYGDMDPLPGRDAIVAFMREKLSNGVITMHVAHHPEIDVDGDTASASWAFEDTVIALDFKVLIQGAGYYHDQYRREADGVWRIAETRYERIYESMESLDDTPSHRLLANRWAAAPSSEG
jgi:uncharacterized protein (TIGR02246 family)